MKSPEQQAAEDHVQEQAAFERARDKLAAARSPADQERKSESLFRQACFRVMNFDKTLLLPLVASGFLLCLTFAEGARPDAFAVILAAVIIIGFVGFRYVRGALHRHPAARAIRLFYLAAFSHGRGRKVAQLADLVVAADLDESARRLPAFNADRVPTSPITSAHQLDTYWTRLASTDDGSVFKGTVSSLKLDELADDLMHATIKLEVAREPGWVHTSYTSVWPVVVVILALVFLEVSIPHEPYFFVFGVVALLALVELTGIVARLLPAYARKEYTVRKLVVRTGESWRMFSGDWQGYEETDLTWLDTVEHKPESPTPGATNP